MINQLDSWKMIVNNLCTSAERKDTIRKKLEELERFWKKISEKIEILSKICEKPH